jgi:hypothetical protein
LLKRGSVVTFTELWVSLRVTVAATRGAGFDYHFVASGSSPDFDSMFYVCPLWFCSFCLFPHFFAHVFFCLYWFATFFLSHLGIFSLSFVLYIAVLHLCHWDFFKEYYKHIRLSYKPLTLLILQITASPLVSYIRLPMRLYILKISDLRKKDGFSRDITYQ